MREARRNGREAASGFVRTLCAGLLAAIGVFFLPVLVVEPMEREAVPPPEAERPAPVRSRDRTRQVHLLRADGRVEELTMEDYLWGVVAAEMPASFEPEALKAQAVAARTYTARLQSGAKPKHGSGELCDDSGCCQAYIDRADAVARWGENAQTYVEKISRAVEETDGLGVLYRGEPIQAVFFSSAAGQTVDAVEVWGNLVDYLKGVDSPEGEEVPGYHSQVTLTAQQVKERAEAKYPGVDLSGPPSEWLTDLKYSGGSVKQGDLGGITLTGSQLRLLFGLRSASFTAAEDRGEFIFQVTGYGHGVGMSQYGANAMAKEGKNFREILTWYYSGTQVGELW